MKNADDFYFQRVIALAEEAFERGDDPFASVLVDENGTIIMEESSRGNSMNHPLYHDTMLLALRAPKEYDREFLGKCTLYAAMEPCIMCTAALYWLGVANIKFIMSESELEALFPGGLNIHSTEFAERSPGNMTSVGPAPEYEKPRRLLKACVDRILGKEGV